MTWRQLQHMKEYTIALVGSNSIHTIRYLTAIAPYFEQIIFITNGQWQNDKPCPDNIITYTINFKLLNLRCRRKIADILLKHKIELVHIQQANSYAYHTLKAIRLYKIKCNTILTTWGSDILILPKKSIMFRRMVKFNLNHADIITSDSLYMSEEIRKLAPHSKTIHTINFGIHNYPELVDMNHKQNIILSNRLHKPLYNIDKIVLAFAKLIKGNTQFADYKLVIAASGTETEKLAALVHKLDIENSVSFVGMLSYSELIDYYKIARIFISIPSSDATSLSVLEAIGYGCYPILSNIPANLEWVLDGINGNICQNNEVLDEYILNAIKTADFEKTAKFNHELIGQKAVAENNLAKFISLYSDLIKS
jgi:glycosyltransferase involved in cell wall biosynthesis